ncbi:16S rRNA (guanine(966)-N(2))-methyltransferase RsmD [Acinetobacter rudis]|uniref:Ribosomal RNA small subunit methyltransferase D n=1 Tax=Acinetobacter rudis TaxID=632955 RepID=A0AAW8J3N9_9GAMM|nr:16S rRNA (guanine(966)-N(2))-methyltransferase RsmD [Acinetobacter rudis]MDQ8934621.1 16S rRNA (guanine(966)-N(2))-methyltransferase RsmD [Acinetobacter rudis]MDQ9016809.1 16S rRNA (guanine(966)-N(2))-methyltransferase RsmD [Acinetobacter rudis]
MRQSVSKNTNQLRIIGGEWKRRLLPFASIDGLRPTPDRVRETLFNWLMWDIQQTTVLDLCAGSGALGFEALSRGATHVTMIEPHHEQCNFLRQNIKLLNIEHCKVLQSTAEQALPKLPNEQFDLVFLDPPYSLDLWQTLAAAVDAKLKQQALIYVEADRDLSLLQLPAQWNLLKQTKAGVVRAGLYQKIV